VILELKYFQEAGTKASGTDDGNMGTCFKIPKLGTFFKCDPLNG